MSDQTPRRPSSGQKHLSGELIKPHSRPSQEDLEDTLSMELDGVCYMSDHILRQLCTKPELCAKDIADSVVMSPTIAQLQPFVGNKSWLPTSSEGKQHYRFLTDAMSKIISCCIDKSKQRYPDTSLPFESLRFIPYDREMAHGIGDSAPVKPDGLGVLSHLLPPSSSNTKIYWSCVEFSVELKKSLRLLFSQVSTYARACFDSRRNRAHTVAFAVNQEKLEVYIIFFHRGGSVSSPALCMTKKEGWETFVRALCGIAHWSLADAGMVMFRTNRFLFLRFTMHDGSAMFGVFKVTKTLDRKFCIRGRATIAETLKLVFLEKTEEHAREKAMEVVKQGRQDLMQDIEVLSNRTHSLMSSLEPDNPQTSQNSANPIDVEVHELEVIRNATFLQVESTQRPFLKRDDLKCLVVKDSWAFRDTQGCDGSILGPLAGSFGLPLVAGYGVAGDNHRFLDKELELRPNPYMTHEKDPSKGKGKDMEMGEKRFHICSFYLSEGRLLSTADSPAQVVRTVLHAAIGHWNLLTKGHRLHRDVSVGNVLIVDPFKCDPPEDLPIANGNLAGEEPLCKGMLIDVDLARKFPYMDGERSGALDLTGTVPFMSEASLQAAEIQDPAFLHSPCDDLESFVWVTVWTVMEKAENANSVLTLSDQALFRDLCSLDIPSVHKGKLVTHKACCHRKVPFLMEEMFREWFVFLDDQKVEETEDTDWREVYDGFLEIGFRHLKEKEGELWSSWDVFFDRYVASNS